MPYNDSDLIISYHDAVIYGSDLKLLEQRTQWLNDSCIHFYFTWLTQQRQQRHLPSSLPPSSLYFMDPSVVSFWMHQCCDEEDINDFVSSVPFPKRQKSSRGRIFVAVNDNMSAASNWQIPKSGNHWSLLVIDVTGDEDDEVQYWHFDSVSSSGNLRAAEDIAQKFRAHVYPSGKAKSSETNLTVTSAETPQQENGYDCGVHVLGAAKVFSNLTDADSIGESSMNSLKVLENSLKTAIGNNPSEFCGNLRTEIASEIQRLRRGGMKSFLHVEK
jgi:sentrin-specific protease 8